jgi:hypothetical protein
MRMIMLALAAATLLCAACATNTTPDQTGAAQPIGPQSPSKMKQSRTTPG